MSSWYDYVPLVGPAVRAAQGDYGAATMDLIAPPFVNDAIQTGMPKLHDYFFGDQAKTQKAALGKMVDQTRALGNESRDFQMQGLDKAENYYAPARARMQAAYGAPGAMRK